MSPGRDRRGLKPARTSGERCVVERDALRRAAALVGVARPRALHQDLPHRQRGDGEEVRAVLELARRARPASRTKASLTSAVACSVWPGPLAADVAGRDAPQLVVDERHQLGSGSRQLRLPGARCVATSRRILTDLMTMSLTGRSCAPVRVLPILRTTSMPSVDLAEDRVPVVEVRRRRQRDEELAAVGVRAGVGHRQDAGLVVAQRRDGTRRRTCSRGRRCPCPSGSPPWIMKPSITRWKMMPS